MAVKPSSVPAPDPLARLLELSHQLGREERKLAILGEGEHLDPPRRRYVFGQSERLESRHPRGGRRGGVSV